MLALCYHMSYSWLQQTFALIFHTSALKLELFTLHILIFVTSLLFFTLYIYTHIQQKGSVYLVVKSEEDGVTILESKVRAANSYQRQQCNYILIYSNFYSTKIFILLLATLIVWTDECGELALSFQEADGCQEIWYVQLFSLNLYTMCHQHFLPNMHYVTSLTCRVRDQIAAVQQKSSSDGGT